MRADVDYHMVLPLVHLCTSDDIASVIIKQLAMDREFPGKRSKPPFVKIENCGIALLIPEGLGSELHLRDAVVRIEHGRPKINCAFFLVLDSQSRLRLRLKWRNVLS
jgi:hypothetical protein